MIIIKFGILEEFYQISLSHKQNSSNCVINSTLTTAKAFKIAFICSYKHHKLNVLNHSFMVYFDGGAAAEEEFASLYLIKMVIILAG